MKCGLLRGSEDGIYTHDRQMHGRIEDLKLDLEAMERKVGDILDDLDEIVPEIRQMDLPIIVLALHAFVEWAHNPEKYLTKEGYDEILEVKEEMAVTYGIEFPAREMVEQLVEDLKIALEDADVGEEPEADEAELNEEEVNEEDITDAEIVEEHTARAI